MDFSSFQYVFFLPLALLIYYLLPHRFRWVFLVASGLTFTAFHSMSSVVILSSVILFNYLIARRINRIEHNRKKQITLIISLIFNVGILCLYKYYNAINRGSSYLSDLLNIENPLPIVEWILPLGISYYIFQSIGYTIEVYRGSHKPENHLGVFAAWLTFFPKMLAGPIERAHDFLPQLKNKIALKYENFSYGGRLILWGLFKKVVIAGQIDLITTPVFENPDQYSGLPLIFSMFLYTVEIYADFSGYTDIALGGGRLFGIKLTQNFQRPLLSTSLTDFWRRWHITLSSWVNDYIYSPLSMWISLNLRLKKWGIIFSVFFSFLLLGLWHGSSKTFAIFGAVQGIIMAYEILTKQFRQKLSTSINPTVYRTLSILFTLMAFSFSCIYFKADAITDANDIIIHSGSVIGSLPVLWDFISAEASITGLIAVVIFLIADHIIFKKGFEIWCDTQKIILRWSLYAVLIFAIIVLSGVNTYPFIYSGF